MIKNILGNEDLLNNTKYEKIEINLRKELQIILELIKEYITLESFEPKKYNKDSLLEELKESKNIINKRD